MTSEILSPQEGFLQIGEAAARSELTQRTLRYYEEKGLLRPPTRMDGGFRLYSSEDMARLERIKELKELLGFSLADIKEMLEAEDVKMQIRAEWRKEADASEKAPAMRKARELTKHQIDLIDQKMWKMSEMRNQLAERLEKYDRWLATNAPGSE
ncbi:MAG TPA: MerR family transcriptional regulator [Tepidiformaceae bacterium]